MFFAMKCWIDNDNNNQKLDNNRYLEYFEVNPPSYELEKPINHNWVNNLESNLEEFHSWIALDSPDP